jgi:hypothetical protein
VAQTAPKSAVAAGLAAAFRSNQTPAFSHMAAGSDRFPASRAEVAAQAERTDPVVDTISGSYAQHPDVVKALGGMALAIAMAKIAQRQ